MISLADAGVTIMAYNRSGISNDAYEDADLFIKTGRKVRKGIDRRVDAYLNGEYDVKQEARKHAVRGVTTTLVVLSLLTGLAFSSPAEINEEQAANYRPAPVVMDVDDFLNATVDDDDDDADEQRGGRIGIVARFKQAVLTMPQSVRLLVVTPLWLIGTGLMTMISYLWNILFASPLGAFIASLAVGFAVLTGLFAATAKILFPDVPLNRILCKRNLIALAVTALVLSGLDAVAPLYWNRYPLAAAGLKLVIGGSVIGLLSVRTKNLFYKLKHHGMPPVTA